MTVVMMMMSVRTDGDGGGVGRGACAGTDADREVCPHFPFGDVTRSRVRRETLSDFS